MRNMITICIISSGFLLLPACSATTITQAENTLKPANINVDVAIPEHVKSEQVSLLQVKLTQNNQSISDAEDVHLKIWKANQEQGSKQYKAVLKGEKTDHNHREGKVDHQEDSNGVYESNVIFQEDGVYYVQAYVKAHGVDLLPTKRVLVGSPSKEELQDFEKEKGQQGNQDQHDHSHHH